METCMALGMLNREQAQQLAGAGLDYDNHDIDTSERYYGAIVGTRTFGDRLAPIPAKVTITSCFGGLA
jgi:biotin synthase